MTEKIALSWSGGKDSAMALYEIKTNKRYNGYCVESLLTTLTEGYDRISGHGVRRDLLERQVESLSLKHQKVYNPQNANIENYESVNEDTNMK